MRPFLEKVGFFVFAEGTLCAGSEETEEVTEIVECKEEETQQQESTPSHSHEKLNPRPIPHVIKVYRSPLVHFHCCFLHVFPLLLYKYVIGMGEYGVCRVLTYWETKRSKV
jgi:hypothetical protein